MARVPSPSALQSVGSGNWLCVSTTKSHQKYQICGSKHKF